MSTRQRNLLFLVVILVLGAVGFYFGGGTSNAPSVLDGVPSNSFIVATIDMRALRASPFASKLGNLGEGGMAEVKSKCGFDPLERASEIAICVPEEEAPGEFGVIARGDLDMIEVASCAEKLAEARGSKTRVAESNGFTIVEDEAGSERTISRIALHKGGPLIVGAGKWLDTMMDVVTTGRGSVKNDEAHAALREAVSDGAPAVVVTAILPKSLRERVRASLDEPSSDEASAAMQGVLGVSRVAAAFSPGGPKATLVVELWCETDDQCGAVERLVERKRKAASEDMRLRLVGIGGLLQEIKVERKGATVRASLTHDADDLARIAQNAYDAAVSGASQKPEKKALRPDEDISAPRDGGR